ncbi:cytochrome P450 302a1, mitochondrial-like, partial [Olea europaea subsp. europaea]
QYKNKLKVERSFRDPSLHLPVKHGIIEGFRIGGVVMLTRQCPILVLARRCNSNIGGGAQPFHAIPGPKSFPLIGNIWRYLPLVGDYNINDLSSNATFNRQRYGPIVREQITSKHVILHLFDPQDIESFFRQDGVHPHRRSHRALLKFRHDNPKRYNDGGIFPENGPNWLRLRNLFNQYLMKKPSINSRLGLLDGITTRSIASLESPSIVIEDFAIFLYKWTMRCALATFLDYDWASMPEERTIEKLLNSSDDLLAAIAGTEINSERWFKQPDKCPYFNKLTKAEDFTYAFVSERIEHLLATNSFNERSFLRDWLVCDKLDRKDVIAFVLDCLLASIHTTAYTTTFLLENISRQLDVQDRLELMREIRKNAPSMGAEMRDSLFQSMPLLRDCLKETLRLHPVSIGTGRLTQSEMIISNFHVPRNVMVILHNQNVCRQVAYYASPLKYCPKRWAQYRAQSRDERPSRFAWLPFGFGARACIGQHLANTQIQILAIRLLQNFDIEFFGDIKTETSLVHCLDGKIMVKLTPVDSNKSTQY